MLTKEQFDQLTAEQKAELTLWLTPEVKVETVQTEVKQVEGTTTQVVQNTVDNPEVKTETKTEVKTETVETPKVETKVETPNTQEFIQKSIQELKAQFDKQNGELLEQIKALAKKNDDNEATIKELKRTTPMGGFVPKPSESHETSATKQRDELAARIHQSAQRSQS